MAAAHLAAPDRPLSLDKIARSGMAADSVQGPAAKGASTQGADADENFTGSAYFYAEDAFAVAALPEDDPLADNPHILMLDRGPAAEPINAARLLPSDRARALQCLTNAIYYEAGNEPEEGQRAVAQVVLNRVASPLWPNSVCATVYQGGERSDMRCQFTFSCDGSMARPPARDKWARAWNVARRALDGETFAPAGLATFYHTLAVRPPWSDTVKPVAVIGAHIFYRLPDHRGRPGAFGQRLTGIETAQPGPYAYVRPSGPLPLPPVGPQSQWLASAAAPMVVTAPAMPQATVPLGSNAPPGANLPSSRIRPEYLNSGRALDPARRD